MTDPQPFAALADPTRRTVFERLLDGPRTVGELATGLAVTRSAVSQHLRALRLAGLATETRAGRHVRYAVAAGALEALGDYASRARARLAAAAAAGMPAAAGAGSPVPDRVDHVIAMLHAAYPQFDATAVAIATRIELIGRASAELLERRAARFRINAVEFRLLGTLRRLPPPHEAAAGDLARISLISAPGLVKHLDRLVRLGLALRRPNPGDGRSRLVRLAPAGIAVADEITVAHLSTAFAATFSATPAERSRLGALLRTTLDQQQHLLAETPRRTRRQA